MSIDIGCGAIDFGQGWYLGGYTQVDKFNPSNATGTLNTFQVFCRSTNITGFKIGTFYGSGTSYTNRDGESIGTVVWGSVQTFSGLNCDVTTGDFIGTHADTGQLGASATGKTAVYEVLGDKFGAGSATYTAYANYGLSVYGTGSEAPFTSAINRVTITPVASIKNISSVPIAMVNKVGGVQ